MLALSLLIAALLPPLAVFLLYPGLLLLKASAREKSHLSQASNELPSVAMIIAVRNGEQLIGAKLENAFSLDYPRDKFSVIVISDGSSDRTAEIIAGKTDERLTYQVLEEHKGKAHALNLGAQLSDSEVLVFSDADAILTPEALKKLVSPMSDPRVGGVCGQRKIQGSRQGLQGSQSRYIDFDSWIKCQESDLGYLTSNDGKLHAIRKSLFTPVIDGVTDDLFSALNVIAQRYAFVFSPDAVAHIALPSRNPKHEIARRRRITCRSLCGIWHHKQLLNPFHYGLYAIALIINKILRRCLGVGLVFLLLANLAAVQLHPIFWFTLCAQLLFYGVALQVPRMGGLTGKIEKLAFNACYFVLGNLGMLLGIFDFLLNRRIVKWEPVKND